MPDKVRESVDFQEVLKTIRDYQGQSLNFLKNYRSNHHRLPKTLDFIGVLALFLALCEMGISQFSRKFQINLFTERCPSGLRIWS